MGGGLFGGTHRGRTARRFGAGRSRSCSELDYALVREDDALPGGESPEDEKLPKTSPIETGERRRGGFQILGRRNSLFGWDEKGGGSAWRGGGQGGGSKFSRQTFTKVRRRSRCVAMVSVVLFALWLVYLMSQSLDNALYAMMKAHSDISRVASNLYFDQSSSLARGNATAFFWMDAEQAITDAPLYFNPTELGLCGDVLAELRTPSMGHAMAICLGTTGCTMVSRRINGLSRLCRSRGKFPYRGILTILAGWTSSSIGGCNVPYGEKWKKSHMYNPLSPSYFSKRIRALGRLETKWETIALHRESKSATACAVAGIAAFESRVVRDLRPVSSACLQIGGELDDEKHTFSLQHAALQCLSVAGCEMFLRNSIGRTVFCGKRGAQQGEEDLHHHVHIIGQKTFQHKNNVKSGGGGGGRGGGALESWFDTFTDISKGTTRTTDYERHDIVVGCLKVGGKLGICLSCLSASDSRHLGLFLPEANAALFVDASKVGLMEQEHSANDWTSSEAFVSLRGKLVCNRVLAKGRTNSLAILAQLCAAEPHCTAATRGDFTGHSFLCQGYHHVILSEEADPHQILFRKGCELYRYLDSDGDFDAGVAPECLQQPSVAYVTEPPKNFCPDNLYSVAVPWTFSSTWPAVGLLCDECPDASCPALEHAEYDDSDNGDGSRVVVVPANPTAFAQKFSKVLDMTARHFLGRNGKAFNPSIAKLDQHLYVAFRATTATRCDAKTVHGEWTIDDTTLSTESHIGFCRGNAPPPPPAGQSHLEALSEVQCTILSNVFSFDAGVANTTLTIDGNKKHGAFVGYEDPRLFSKCGQLYVLANIGMKLDEETARRRERGNVHVRRMALLRIRAVTAEKSAKTRRHPDLSNKLPWHTFDVDFEASIDRVVLVNIPGTDTHSDVKNTVPMVIQGSCDVNLVYSFAPYRSCELDTETGECHDVNTTSSAMATGGEPSLHALEKMGHLRGSTQLLHMPKTGGYLGLIHRKQDLELGRSYTHKFVLLSDTFPYAPLWYSTSFKLPIVPDMSPDLQFAAGLMLTEDTPESLMVTISYGQSDCVSWVATLLLPQLAEMRAAQRRNNPSAAQPVVIQQQQQQPSRLRPRQVPSEENNDDVDVDISDTEGEALPSIIKVRWDGPVLEWSGFATVARELGSRLVKEDDKFQLVINDMQRKVEKKAPRDIRSFHQHGNQREDSVLDPQREAMVTYIARGNADLAAPDVTVRLQWIVNLAHVAPPGALVVYLPWEFGVIPQAWVTALNTAADEVWSPAEYGALQLRKSGVMAEKIRVVPHGIPSEFCREEGEEEDGRGGLMQRSLNGVASSSSSFPAHVADSAQRTSPVTFLYHGGLLYRKGIDILIASWKKAFLPTDRSVLLIIHSVYGDHPVQEMVEEFVRDAARGRYAPVNFDDRELSSVELSALYRQVDLLIHPARSEGFGIGVIEAMAHSLPVIAPRVGPLASFVTQSNGYPIAATEVPCLKYPCFWNASAIFTPDWKAPPPFAFTWFEMDPAEVAQTMRIARDDALLDGGRLLREKGRRSKEDVCGQFTWDKAYEIYKTGLEEVVEKKRKERKKEKEKDVEEELYQK